MRHILDGYVLIGMWCSMFLLLIRPKFVSKLNADFGWQGFLVYFILGIVVWPVLALVILTAIMEFIMGDDIID